MRKDSIQNLYVMTGFLLAIMAAIKIFPSIAPPGGSLQDVLQKMAADPKMLGKLKEFAKDSPIPNMVLEKLSGDPNLVPKINEILDKATGKASKYVGIGVIMQQKGHPAEAEKMYLEAIRVDPNHLSAWRAISLLYQDQGREADAQAAFERVREIEQAEASGSRPKTDQNSVKPAGPLKRISLISGKVWTGAVVKEDESRLWVDLGKNMKIQVARSEITSIEDAG